MKVGYLINQLIIRSIYMISSITRNLIWTLRFSGVFDFNNPDFMHDTLFIKNSSGFTHYIGVTI